jgi:hypothetical protein
VIDQNSAHGLGREAEELRAALPVDAALIHQLDVGLVYERRAFEGVVRPLVAQVPGRDAVQFLIDERHQSLECLPIAFTPTPEQIGDVGWRPQIVGHVRAE